MSDNIRVPNDFYQGRVYYCPCLMGLVNQIYHDDFFLFAEILQAVALFKPSSIHTSSYLSQHMWKINKVVFFCVTNTWS